MAVQSIFKEHVSWYEATLSVKERRSLGHFSTPPRLVEHILDACGYTTDKNLANIRVLDPACGSGNFLVGAARRLLAFGTRTDLTQTELTTLMQRNIWGFDPDPISCFLAEMQLRTTIAGELVEGAMHWGPEWGVRTSWHIHQADGLALRWNNEPSVDLFVANPPYLATKNADLSSYRLAQQRGQIDSYLLFFNLGLQTVRPGGWLGVVLPDPVLARTNATVERARLLKEFSIHHLWHLSDVFAAQVGAVVIIAQKCVPKSTHQVAWVREKWQVDGNGLCATRETLSREQCFSRSTQAIPQSLFLRQPNAEFRYLLSSEGGSTIERLHAYLAETVDRGCHFAPLSDFLLIRRGEELGSKSSLLVRQDTLYPVLRGGRDVRPYGIAFDGWWIAREAVRKPIERYLAPKLLVVKSTNHLQASLDTQGHVALQTLYLLYPHAPQASLDSLYFFLALLNSRLLRQYVYVLHTAYKWVQPQIEQQVLARLPVPLTTSEQRQEIIAHARLLSRACSEIGTVVEWKAEIQRMYEEQERTICALYNAALPGLFG